MMVGAVVVVEDGVGDGGNLERESKEDIEIEVEERD